MAGRHVVRRGTWPVSIGRLLLLLLAETPVMPVSVSLVMLPIEGLRSKWCLCLIFELPKCGSKFPR